MTQSYPDKATLSFLFFNVCSVIKPLALSFVISSIWKEISNTIFQFWITEKNLKRRVIPGSEASIKRAFNRPGHFLSSKNQPQADQAQYLCAEKRHSARKFRNDTKPTIINVMWVCRGPSKLYNDPLYNHNKSRRKFLLQYSTIHEGWSLVRRDAHFKNGQEQQNERLTTNCFLKRSRYTQMRKKALTQQASLETLRKILGHKAQRTREGKRYFFSVALFFFVSGFALTPQTPLEHPQKCLSYMLVFHVQLCEYAGQFQL